MADHDVKIRIAEEGAGKAAGGIGLIGKAFRGLLTPIRAVHSAVGLLFKTLGAVSLIVHGISLIADAAKRLHEWMNRAKTAAYELMKAGQDARFADQLEKAVEKAKYLRDNLSGALDRLKQMQQYGDAWSAGRRGIEAAQMDLQEQRELSGVADAGRRQRISEGYALRRAEAEWRNAANDASRKSDSIDSQISAAKANNAMEAGFQRETERKFEEQRFWLRDGRLTKEEFESRYKIVESLEKELNESKKRVKANDELIVELLRQKTLLAAPVERARISYEAKRQETANAQAERERKAAEDFVAASEKSARRHDRDRADAQIDVKEKELSRAEDALKAEPAVALANDRITAMGGFATAGAAAISGIAAGPDRTYQELRAQRDLLRQEIEQLKRIVKNTEDGGATFQ